MHHILCIHNIKIKLMIYIHNSKNKTVNPTKSNQLPLPLSDRGVKQAQRNQSDDIWNLMNWCSEQATSVRVCYYCGMPNCEKCATHNPSQTNRRQDSNDFSEIKPKTQRDLIKQSDNDNLQGSLSNREKTFERSGRSRGKDKSVSFREDRNQERNSGVPLKQTNLTQEDLLKRQKYLRECYSIQKYLSTSKAYTRTMPNSAVRLFYQKPCFQSYGRKNTSGNNGFIYNDYLKTHNMQPHRHENDPKKYQSYRSALNFGKRAKLDPEERMKLIHRQFSSKLDLKAIVDDFSVGYIPVTDDQLSETLKYNIDHLKPQYSSIKRSKSSDHMPNYNKTLDLSSTAATSKLNLTGEQQEEKQENRKRRSKSVGKKDYLFLYRYENKDGDTQYCKDRHGITCYVDPTFQENKDAYTNFLKKINPIEGENVRKQDRGIDKIMVGNYLKSQQQDVPKHYLMPNCQEPYRPEKYSVKARKKSLAGTSASSRLEEMT